MRADQLHICMEYMDGKPAGLSADSVANMLKKYGPFQEEHIARYTFQVLKGLHYLHSKHIIHSDLKVRPPSLTPRAPTFSPTGTAPSSSLTSGLPEISASSLPLPSRREQAGSRSRRRAESPARPSGWRPSCCWPSATGARPTSGVSGARSSKWPREGTPTGKRSSDARAGRSSSASTGCSRTSERAAGRECPPSCLRRPRTSSGSAWPRARRTGPGPRSS